MGNDTFDAESTDRQEIIQEYSEQFKGETTAVEGQEYPSPDGSWFDLITWLMARADADTLKFDDPGEFSDADEPVVTLHEAESGYRLTRVSEGGETQLLADEELVRKLNIDRTSTLTGEELDIVWSGEGQDLGIQVEKNEGDNEVTLSAIDDGSVVELASGLSDGVGESTNDATDFPVVPKFDETRSEIESNRDVPDGGLVFSNIDDQLYLSDGG